MPYDAPVAPKKYDGFFEYTSMDTENELGFERVDGRVIYPAYHRYGWEWCLSQFLHGHANRDKPTWNSDVWADFHFPPPQNDGFSDEWKLARAQLVSNLDTLSEDELRRSIALPPRKSYSLWLTVCGVLLLAVCALVLHSAIQFRNPQR